MGDLLLLFAILSVLWRDVSPDAVLCLRLFALGTLLLIVADVAYDYVSAHSTYLGGDPTDAVWIVSRTLIALSAAARLRSAKPTGVPVAPPPMSAPA